MRYTIEMLRAEVMARLGEASRAPAQEPESSMPLLEGIMGPEDIIGLKAESLLAEVGGRLIKEAPYESLGCGVVGLCGDVSMRLMPCGLYAAEVRLPERFLRLVSAAMGGWRGSVHTLITPSMTDWHRQWSAHPGIAGCPEWPRAYLDSDGEGQLLRLAGSLSAEDTLEWLGIWLRPTVSADGAFDFPELLYPDLVGRIVLSLQSST